MPRFFLKLQDINNKTISFDEHQSKKIRKVLRMKVGDMVRAFDGKGWEYEAQLISVRNEASYAKIVDQKLHDRTSNITLYQALPKNLKTEIVLQKCTELGVDRIVFFESEFSQVDSTKISKEKVRRWRRIAIEAAEQCGRLFLPEIELFTEGLAELLERVDHEGLFYLDPAGKWLSQLSEPVDLMKLGVLVGPEGGFSPTEMKLLDSKKIKKVKISEQILRSETAGMTFIAQATMPSK